MFHPKETEWSIINNRPFQNCIISKRESLRYFCYEAATAAFVQKVAEAKNDPEGGKIMGIFEYLDSKIVAPVKKALEDAGEDFRMLLLPDHPNPIRYRTHTADPVPYLLYDSRVDSGLNLPYCEESGLKGPAYPEGAPVLMHKLFER